MKQRLYTDEERRRRSLESGRRWRARNRVADNAASNISVKKWKAEHPDEWKARAHKYYMERKANRPEIFVAGRLRRRYGITPEQRTALFAKQEGVCAVCDYPLFDDKRSVVDHDHETLAVRGILHRECNLAIGHLNDDPAILDRAAAYLRGQA